MSVELDKFTKQMAEEYADNEGDIHGFKRGSAKWKSCFADYCKEAIKTMSIGRNPISLSNPSVASLKPYFPELFGETGVAHHIARNYTGEEMPEMVVDQRILAGITNLVKLFEAGKMGSKTRGKRKAGSVPNSEMSDFQMPKRPQGMTTEEYQKLTRPVLRRWVMRDLLTTLCIESLLPFLTMSKDDVNWILDALNVDAGTIQQYQGSNSEPGMREQIIKKLHQVISRHVIKTNFKRIIYLQASGKKAGSEEAS